MWIPSEEPLDLFCLFSASHLLSDARRLLTALPFLCLVSSNPRFECVEFVAFRRSGSDLVEEGQIAAQLLALCECLALEPVAMDASAFRPAEQLRDMPNVALDVAGVIR
jgi:hypothetical protein